MSDIPINALRYFCTLADELHFGAAAERLHITPPSLSQQISRLESVVGARLFDRGPRAITLTATGEELLPLAREAVEIHSGVIAWVAARTLPAELRLRIGVAGAGAGQLTTRVIRAVAAQVPGLRWEMKQIGFFDVVHSLATGVVDVVFAPGPVEQATDSVVASTLMREPRVAVMSADHRLASRTDVSILELVDETFISLSGGTGAANAWWLVDPRPDGSRPQLGPVAHDFEGVLELCAAGLGINIAGATAASQFRRNDLRYVPISDIEPASVLLYTRPRAHRHVASFVAIAQREARHTGSNASR